MSNGDTGASDEEALFPPILDAFSERADSLAEHLRLSMLMITTVNKYQKTRLREFVKAHGIPVEGSSNRRRIPWDHFGEFERLRKRVDRNDMAVVAVPRSFLVALVSEFDAFISDILRALYTLKPESLNASQRTLTFAELQEFPSIEAAREHLIDKDVETFLRSSHSEQFTTLEQKLGIPLTKDLAIWPSFIELTERRNLFVHNDGVVSRHYLETCSKAGFDCSAVKKGDRLEASPAYFTQAHETLHEIAAKLTYVVWRKLDPKAAADADEYLVGGVIYDLLASKHYRLARALSDFVIMVPKKGGSGYFRKALVINRAQAYLWDGMKADALKQLDAEDWSACNNELKLGVAALKADLPQALSLMHAIGQAERPGKRGYREWPVFLELRGKKEFQDAFETIFNEPFTTVRVSDEDPAVTLQFTPTRPVLKAENEVPPE